MSQEEYAILHVDDYSPVCDLVQAQVERRDSRLSITGVPSMKDANTQLQQRDVDCVLSGWNPPNGGGMEFLQAVRSEYPDLPFIFYTAKEPAENVEKAISSGADAYVQKQIDPWHYEELIQHVTSLVEKYRAKERLDYLEQKQHITDGGMQPEEKMDRDRDQNSVSMDVVEAVAAREGVNPIALSPLSDSIDPDALDALFPRRAAENTQGAQLLTFTYCEYTITVSKAGDVTVDG